MNFHEFGNKENPAVMLIHGGGNAWWNYLRQAKVLSENYYVILPTLDGHGDECDIPYRSTEETVDKLMEYIEEKCEGKLFALGGVSLGGQIVVELLSRKPDIARKAIIDGSVCYPTPFTASFCKMSLRLAYPFMFSEKAVKKQVKQMAKILPEKMQFSEEIKGYYLEDMPKLPKKTMMAIYDTYMHYQLKDTLKSTKAEILYCFGEKEMKCVKKSADLVCALVPKGEVYEAKGYGHGYLSVYLPGEWLDLALAFFHR